MSTPAQALTIWLTGLSGAGKTTLARALHAKAEHAGLRACVLDGDELRLGLNRDLGFSTQERAENVRRSAEVARLMNDAGLLVIAAFVSPFRRDREMARRIVGAERFREVHVSTPLAVCELRDPKGLYDRARSGSLPGFTGVSATYEVPDAPALRIDTSHCSPSRAVEDLLGLVSSCRAGPTRAEAPSA